MSPTPRRAISKPSPRPRHFRARWSASGLLVAPGHLGTGTACGWGQMGQGKWSKTSESPDCAEMFLRHLWTTPSYPAHAWHAGKTGCHGKLFLCCLNSLVFHAYRGGSICPSQQHARATISMGGPIILAVRCCKHLYQPHQRCKALVQGNLRVAPTTIPTYTNINIQQHLTCSSHVPITRISFNKISIQAHLPTSMIIFS